ncbi:MAG TPA: hypothetical protein VK864_01530 [Longimicrobiales bacterium]|nr:hypothetical protein [Longimicrobiales bacterium]
MRTTFKLSVSALILALPLAGCDSDEAIDLELTRFTASLAPLNSTTRPLTGSASIDIITDALRATVDATGLDQTRQMQFVATGSRCPTASDDTNADGFVDVVEGMAAYGEFLLALDETLTVQEDNTISFPTGPSYIYVEAARYSDIENSLRDPNITPNLAPAGDFDPQGRPVVILGTTEDLPGTVATLPGFTAKETLPVACGVLTRVTAN